MGTVAQLSQLGFTPNQAKHLGSDSPDFGILPVSNGGTGLSTLGSAYSVLSINSAGNALTYATSTTFTPSWASVSGTGTFSGGYARAQRLGNFVNISVYTAFSQATANTNEVTLILPYFSVNDGIGQVCTLPYSASTGGQLYGQGLILIAANSTTCTFRRSNPFTAWATTVPAVNEIWANFTYQAEP